MKQKTMIITFTLCMMIMGYSCSQKKEKTDVTFTNKAHKIDSLISLYTEYEGFNGAVLISHQGKLILKKGYGLANKTWDIPNTPTTKFKIASLTKSFTAILILQLVNEGIVALHQPISHYISEDVPSDKSNITIHHLLTHSSGIPRDFSKDINPKKPQEMTQEILTMPLLFSPGERFEYSNLGYDVLGYIVETQTGMSYEEALQERIFDPLDMKNSGYFTNQAIFKQMASGYYKGFGDYFNVIPSNNSHPYASGGLYSTVEDLYRLDQAFTTYSVMPNEYQYKMFEKHVEDLGYGGYYGYGWELVEKPIGNSGKKVETIGHSGVIPGFCALYTRIPSSNSAIIFLNNTQRAFLNSMTTAITGILYDETYDFPKTPLAKSMSKIIDKEGLEAGISYFKAHQNNTNYYVNEQELIVTGYTYLHTGKIHFAAEIFKLCIAVFPNKDNPYDSYAEALLALGEKEKAIFNYKKSLELNPKNRNAKAMLEKLGSE